MFKKLLTVGTLVAGIALTGGIGVASANDCPLDQVPIYQGSGLYTQYVVHSSNVFSNKFSRYESRFGKTITWYFKFSKPCGNGLYTAYYEGRAS
ncbi:LCI fold-containing protein [Photorhabdus temperata]|uniref:LCI fold-containing protein n=1 Tax=Photorhabdus temperata TaxID=574560 RepID=UPI00038A1AF4|nr:LCI fold-containing protein [Photorhabdus temperata]EQC01149.1 hypothetical protein B738_06239 [Photorhabdus temperata subsp. temperata M1021]